MSKQSTETVFSQIMGGLGYLLPTSTMDAGRHPHISLLGVIHPYFGSGGSEHNYHLPIKYFLILLIIFEIFKHFDADPLFKHQNWSEI